MQLNNFSVKELVPEEVYIDRGEKSIEIMDKELLVFIDNLRDHLGRRITINTWEWGGLYSYRGLRTENSTHYKPYSQHTFGKALDFDVDGMTAEAVRQWIVANRNMEWVQPITFIEGDVGWVHVDTRPTNQQGDLWLWSIETNTTQVFKRG
jgi:uncharacterized protein YcbK (DUF882 family)